MEGQIIGENEIIEGKNIGLFSLYTKNLIGPHTINEKQFWFGTEEVKKEDFWMFNTMLQYLKFC